MSLVENTLEQNSTENNDRYRYLLWNIVRKCFLKNGDVNKALSKVVYEQHI